MLDQNESKMGLPETAMITDERDEISEIQIEVIGRSVAWATMERGLATAVAIEEGEVIAETM